MQSQRTAAGRKEGRKEGRNRAQLIASAFVVSGVVGSTPAQTWGQPFDHETITSGPVPNPNATDHLIPFGGYTNGNISYFVPPAPLNIPLDWQKELNAVHMSLIPKGPHQGKVLVWGATSRTWVGGAVLVRAPGSGPALQPTEYWSCTAWSIVDPAPGPVTPRFRNFLLPIAVWDSTIPMGGFFERMPSLFCSGHVWSPYGDLIVAGGTRYNGLNLGANLTFAFNPNATNAGWPGGPGTPLYGSELGLWQEGLPLKRDRFYPTVTLTARLDRLQVGIHPRREVAFIAGGSEDDASSNPADNTTWNEYEALVISSEASVGNPGFATDDVLGVDVWPGPGSPLTAGNPEIEEDWFEDYPRLHLLSTGRLFFSGYAPRWAHVDHDSNPGVWTRQAAPLWSSTTWQHPRHDGSSILFPNVGGAQDLIMRIGGSDETVYGGSGTTTKTAEVFLPNGSGGSWFTAPSLDLPNSQPATVPDGRYLANVVILPDASLLLVGGVARSTVAPLFANTTKPLLFNGTWTELPANPTLSVRDYHSTAILLPDGRVMIGGGNNRQYDYEVFSPAYVASPHRPQNVAFEPSVTYSPQFTADELGYDQAYRVSCDPLPLGLALQKAVLMAPGSTTHHSDMHQRYVELTTNQQTPNLVQIITPLNDKHAPRGIYMLFLLTTKGIPSTARWVVLR